MRNIHALNYRRIIISCYEITGAHIQLIKLVQRYSVTSSEL